MGFDIDCIPNIQSLAGEYFCPVCRLLIYPSEALQSMCTHLYCKPCLSYVASTTRACPYDGYLVTETDAKPLAESNKVLADTIGKIVVNCLYQKSGCTWLGSLSDSSTHCSGCAFGSSLVVCNRCGIQIAHCQGQEHAQVCPGVQQVQVQESQHVAASDQVQASAVVATSQVSAQGQGVAASTLTQEQWYQQQYQQYYQNYYGYYMHQQQAPMSNPQQQLYPPGAPQTASQHQAPYVQPAIQSVVQTHSQVQAQPQLQSQSLVLHQPHTVFPSAPHKGAASVPQAYPSVPPHSQDLSQTFPASQGLQNLQAQADSQPTPLLQAHHLQNPQVPQYQQFHGQINSQLHIQNPLLPQANTVQINLPQNTIGEGQSHQPHAYWTGQKIYPQPTQTNQVEVPPNNVPVYHQVGTQPPQVQRYFPQQVPHVRPPQSLPTMQKLQPSLPSQLTSIQSAKLLLLKYGGVSVSQTSVMHPAQQTLSKPSLPQQHTTAATTDVVHNQMHLGGPSPQIALQSHLPPKGLVQGIHKHPEKVHGHQPITPNHGLQLKMTHHSATALQGGSGQAVPSLPAVKQVDMKRTQNQAPQASWDQIKAPLNATVGKQRDETILNSRETGSTSDSTNAVKHAVEATATKSDPEPKVKRTDAFAESEQSPSTVLECIKTKNGPLGKQVLGESDGNGIPNPGKSPLIEKKGTEVDPSEEVPPGAQRHMHAPRYPPPVLRPHGLGTSSHTLPGPAAALPAERGLRAYGLPHHESEGPYDLHPSQVLKASLSAPKPFPLGLRDERLGHFPDERLLNPASLEPAGLRHFDDGLKHLLRDSHIDSDVFLRSGAYSSGLLDRGFGQRLPLRPHEKHGLDFDLRPTSRVSQPFIDLGERQFRREPGNPISEYPRMSSHGSGPLDHGLGGDRAGANDIEGIYTLGFPRREFEGHGNLQMGKRFRDSDMIGQHGLPFLPRLKEGDDFDGSARRPGDPGFRSKYTLQGFPSDGGSLPGDVGPFQNSSKRAAGVAWCRICKVDCETLEGLDLHSQTKEHQQNSMDMVLMIKQNAKKLKTAPADTSTCSNPNKMTKADLEVSDRRKNSFL